MISLLLTLHPPPLPKISLHNTEGIPPYYFAPSDGIRRIARFTDDIPPQKKWYPSAIVMASLRHTVHPPIYWCYPSDLLMMSSPLTSHPPIYRWYPSTILMVLPRLTSHRAPTAILHTLHLYCAHVLRGGAYFTWDFRVERKKWCWFKAMFPLFCLIFFMLCGSFWTHGKVENEITYIPYMVINKSQQHPNA